MIKLYEAQKTAEEIIINGFKGSEQVDKRNFLVLTGEVGSGKTYVSASIIKKLDKKALIIIPLKNLKEKWEYVLNLAGVTNYNIVTKIPYEKLDEYDLIIYDEFHTVKSKFKKLLTYLENPEKLLLGLTGSAINKYINEFTNIFSLYRTINNKFKSYSEYKKYSYDLRDEYISNYIKYLFTIPLKKDDIKELIQDSITINTISHSIDMNKEETSFYDFLEYRLKQLSFNQSKKIEVLNKYLDRTINENMFVRKSNYDYYVGDILHSETTEKITKLKEILENKKSIIVYTFDDDIAFKLSKNVENLIYVDTTKNANIDVINEHLKTSNIIVNVKNILFGHDIYTDTAVFYQTPEDLTTNIQAIGRISRINNSQNEKNIHYIYHQNTIQEENIKRIEKNNLTNNVLLGKIKKENVERFLYGMRIIDSKEFKNNY